MKIVCEGLLMETDDHKQQIIDGFKQEFGVGVKILGKYFTLPGKGGEGGRSEVVLDLPDEVVPKAAIHPMHLNGFFRWWDDYVASNRAIIPDAALKEFFGEHGNSGEQENESVLTHTPTLKPECKLVGEDGNVFNIIGQVCKSLRQAGMPERAKEFSKKALSSKSYDDVLELCHYYVEVT